MIERLAHSFKVSGLNGASSINARAFIPQLHC
jgi:hypothetical protein